jgi:hypothetical protein
MKYLILVFYTIFIFLGSISGQDTNLSKSKYVLFDTNSVGFDGKTNLVSFFPSVQLLNINEILKTNGLECLINIMNHPFEHDSNAKPPTFWPAPVCFVSVYNHSTNYMGCLRMPATNLCRIVLLDKQGHQVKKTPFGMMYGWPLSQKQIADWRHSWNTTHLTTLIKIVPNGIPKFVGMDTEVCRFSIKDAFEIKAAGEYELHLQIRLIQVGLDNFGKFYYPITWLPEIVAKVQILPHDISP